MKTKKHNVTLNDYQEKQLRALLNFLHDSELLHDVKLTMVTEEPESMDYPDVPWTQLKVEVKTIIK